MAREPVCIECGWRPIASNARVCPNPSCRKNPHGEQCRICGEFDKVSSLMRKNGKMIHASCLAKERKPLERQWIEELRHRCPTPGCGRERIPDFRENGERYEPYFESCPGCGRNDGVYLCCNCHKPRLYPAALDTGTNRSQPWCPECAARLPSKQPKKTQSCLTVIVFCIGLIAALVIGVTLVLAN